MEPSTQLKTVSVDKGLFIFRYAEAEDEAWAPKMEVTVDPASNDDIVLVLHPDHSNAVLWEPGASLIVCAYASGKLNVRVIATRDGGSTAASLRIEPVTQGTPKSDSVMGSRSASASPIDLDDVHLLGHVALLGDVRVKLNDWLAGPSEPARIEGIAIDWPGKPRDLDIKYSVSSKKQAPPAKMVPVGQYAGSRGRALPVVELVFEMSGPGAQGRQFSVEAIFLGSPTMRVTGQRVILAGPTGREPLVGLRLGIEQAAVEAPGPGPRNTSSARSSSRVRVFRSRENKGHFEVS